MKRWTTKHLNQLKQQGTIQDYQIKSQPVKDPSNGQVLKQAGRGSSKALDYIKWNLWYWANENALELLEEHQFCKDRKFRFDFAFPALKIAVEFEGGVFDRNGGHTSFKDFSKDVEKYNLAQRLGWKVLRFTAINYKNLITELNHQLAA